MRLLIYIHLKKLKNKLTTNTYLKSLKRKLAAYILLIIYTHLYTYTHLYKFYQVIYTHFHSIKYYFLKSLSHLETKRKYIYWKEKKNYLKVIKKWQILCYTHLTRCFYVFFWFRIIHLHLFNINK